ncbi:MAG TPA: ResA-like WAxxUGC motif-containing protein [Acidimicrobiales bacterium]|jgi:peroxiredoxin
MLTDRLDVSLDELREHSGWELKPEGACLGDVCIPLRAPVTRDDGRVDLEAFAGQLGMPVVADPAHGLWALGPAAADHVIDQATMPELTLSDFEGRPYDLSDSRGRKVVMVAWASWCGCARDLPSWQALYEELAPHGLDVVTVALDTNVDAARPAAEAAQQTHPSLVDPAHRVVERFGITNVPLGMWIDEKGVIVRPPESAPVPPRAGEPDRAAMVSQLPEDQLRIVAAMTANAGDPTRYTDAVRDWVAKGEESEFVLSEEEVVARSRPLPPEAATAAAHYELGQHLHRSGHGQDAVAHFAAAHDLDPTNWSYQRQARALVHPAWGAVYERDLFTEVGRVGPATWRPAPTI